MQLVSESLLRWVLRVIIIFLKAPPKISCDFETECTALTAVVDKQFTDEWKLVKAEKNSVSGILQFE